MRIGRCHSPTLIRHHEAFAVVQNHSPLSWSVSTWSACLMFLADWYKKTGFSNRTGCCLLLPKKKEKKAHTNRTRKGHNGTWKATLLADLHPARIDEASRWRRFHSPGSRLWARASRGPHSGESPTHIYCDKKHRHTITHKKRLFQSTRYCLLSETPVTLFVVSCLFLSSPPEPPVTVIALK